ncbi:MAG: diaminopimelate decarboxylase [Bacteroidales bacterium]|nr:diaminopimelate decarboxylase [Bacteroidales bacterium]MCB9029360.1 diaminopimelate decarboxylase [Bacteroidales bacterium]HNT92199.1 diaminopimelate decarboxylase [Bacteroidales bacterium]HOO66716.1 diaminopimelate decarboxylase [Bacteroidales bacterium]HPE22988.1 diaminopimelate decarboxylase [Bacteroidales bacterium]
MFTRETKEKLGIRETPFYYYDLEMLKETLSVASGEAANRGYNVHYAVKANFNPVIMRIIAGYGLGADCVSCNEVEHAIACGFPPHETVFAGVGKSDREIETALKIGIKCFNVESAEELEVIDSIAGRMGKKASVALRINPNVEAHTIRHITTGTDENKFGIRITELDAVLELMKEMENVHYRGIHFHIGSQITDLHVFRNLCTRINELWQWLTDRGFEPEDINVGGGLGVNYDDPDQFPPFADYFDIFKNHLDSNIHSTISFELGRSLTANCGSLITKVLYVKPGASETFVILDAGMTELMRPALYHAYHRIENLTSEGPEKKYTVVGPICESTDTFGKFIALPETRRGDLIAIRSAGAYGEVMASRYNMRSLPESLFSEE